MQRLRTLHLFAGAGGGILADLLLGHQPVCAVEIDPYCQQVLSARQKDGCLPWFPIFGDVQQFDGKPWQGIVDVVSGGFPCQDISAAGKGAGITGERSGLWSEMARIIGEVRPGVVFVENSPMLTSRGLGTVLGDLAEMGFDAEWGVLSAADVGANHRRERIWILAHTELHRLPKRWGITFAIEGGKRQTGVCSDVAQGVQQQEGEVLAYSASIRQQGSGEYERSGHKKTHSSRQADRAIDSGKAGSDWWQFEPRVGRVAYGVAYRMDRLKAIGNGQVPLCAATAFRLLAERAGIEGGC